MLPLAKASSRPPKIRLLLILPASSATAAAKPKKQIQTHSLTERLGMRTWVSLGRFGSLLLLLQSCRVAVVVVAADTVADVARAEEWAEENNF